MDITLTHLWPQHSHVTPCGVDLLTTFGAQASSHPDRVTCETCLAPFRALLADDWARLHPYGGTEGSERSETRLRLYPGPY